VNDDGAWSEEGTLSFANYGLKSAPFYTNVFANPQKAYMAYNAVDRVVWDADSMTILGAKPALAALQTTRDGMTVRQGYERAVRDDKVFQPFYWGDANLSRVGKLSQIAVYDGGTDDTRALLDAQCPGLHLSTIDEEGNLYFSNGVYPAPGPIFFPDAPSTCAVRIKAGQEVIDPDFSLRFSDVTDGREGAAFRYLGGGKGFMSVLYKERVTVDATTTPASVANSANWRIWTIDLNTRAAAPMDGIDFISGQYFVFTFEGRTFILLPGQDYKSTTVYEVKDGKAVKRFESVGWAYEMVKIR